MKKTLPASKYDRLFWLLGAYGNGDITTDEFWAQMKQSGCGQNDIDQWCAEYHERNQHERQRQQGFADRQRRPRS